MQLEVVAVDHVEVGPPKVGNPSKRPPRPAKTTAAVPQFLATVETLEAVNSKCEAATFPATLPSSTPSI